MRLIYKLIAVNYFFYCIIKHMKILIVDDEQKITNVLAERLRLRDIDARSAYDGMSALELMRKEAFDGIVLDLRLPDIDGIEVLQQTMEAFPGMKVVMLSGHATEQDFKTCLDLGAIACFHKPANISKITEVLFKGCLEDDKDN